jgi:hypothetical protein
MTKNQIVAVLSDHGFPEGRCIAGSKTGYCRCHPKNFVVFNAQVLSQRDRILKQVDLDLTLDAENLAAAARAAGENFHVLYENRPHLAWQPESGPMSPVLRDAVWWTRIRAEEADVFLPPDSVKKRLTRTCLACSTGFWQGQCAFAVDVWLNPEWHNQHMSGAVICLIGQPPKHLRVAERAKRNEEFEKEPSRTRGRAVRPVLRQKSGLLEFIWFSHGVAVPAVLWDNSMRLMTDVTFTIHTGSAAIHIRRQNKVIGLIWPCSVRAPEVAANAHAHLKARSWTPKP